MADVTEAVGILRDFLSMIKSIHKPLIVKFVVRRVGTSAGLSVGPSKVVLDLTEDTEDATEAVGDPRDFLSISKSIHKPDRGDIDGYRFLIHNLRENSKRPHFRSLLYELSSRF